MLSPNDLYEIRKIIVATQLIMKGDFDKEMERIDKAADVAAANRKAELESYEYGVQSRIKQAKEEADAALVAANERTATVEALAAQVGKTQEDMTALALKTRAEYSELEKQKKTFEKQQAEAQAQLAKAQESLSSEISVVQMQRQTLAEEQAKLSAKLDSLKALAQ
jgi:chromosome segregation ATPase